MAALSSTQSGNWSSSSTWGGVTPADGDTFTINRGHKVTVNSDQRPTNGYGDITVYGNLHITTNGKFRLNGRITVWGQNTGDYNSDKWFVDGDNTTGGLLSTEGNNVVIEVRGNNADQHGIWVETQRFASMKLDADDKKTTTALSAAISVFDEYITVDSTTGFAAEDWIAVYRDGNQDNRVLGDEGFWVHDVDSQNNRIYIRQYVSPTAVISKKSGSTITVDNAKVFRIGYKIIFGIGANRNVRTITDINYVSNVITLDSTVTGTVDGLTVYQTGAEKPHVIDDAVQKIATTLTTAITSADSTDQITVGSANDISVGDEIVIDVNNDTDTNWDYDSKYTVTAKSGNTLTLDDQVRHLHKVGSLVNILTRHVTIKGVDTSTDTRPFLYTEYWTDFSNCHTRHIMLRNVRFTQWGNNTNNTYYRGVMIAGYNSEYRDDAGSDGRYQFQSRVQGIVVDSCNTPDQNYTGLTTRHPYGIVVRNNCVYHAGAHPYWQWSSQYNVKFYNNYATRSAYCTFYSDAMYEPYTETAYCYFTRSDDYGFLMHQNREGSSVRHMIFLNHETYPFYMYYTSNGFTFDRMYFDGYRSFPHHGESNGPINWIDCYFGNRWYKSADGQTTGPVSSNYLFNGSPGGRNIHYRNTGTNSYGAIYEWNFEYDKKAEYYGGGLRLWDPSENAWAVYQLNASDYPMFISYMYVPANTVVRISAFLKGEDNSNYSFPYLFARKSTSGYNMGRFRTDYTNQTSVLSSSDSTVQKSSIINFRDTSQFTSAMRGAWEERQLTIPAFTYSYSLVYGIYGSNNLSQEKTYMRDINVYFDKPISVPVTNDTPGKRPSIRTSFTQVKKRISGRI